MRTRSFFQNFAVTVAATVCAVTLSLTSPASAQYPLTSLDYGPFTAEANSAYMGGGVIIEYPAPVPQQYTYSVGTNAYYPTYYNRPAAYAQPYPVEYYRPPAPHSQPVYYQTTPVYPYAPGYFCRWPGYC